MKNTKAMQRKARKKERQEYKAMQVAGGIITDARKERDAAIKDRDDAIMALETHRAENSDEVQKALNERLADTRALVQTQTAALNKAENTIEETKHFDKVSRKTIKAADITIAELQLTIAGLHAEMKELLDPCPVCDPDYHGASRCDTEDCENIVLPDEGYDLGEGRRNSCIECKHSHDNGDDEPDFEQLHAPNAGRGA